MAIGCRGLSVPDPYGPSVSCKLPERSSSLATSGFCTTLSATDVMRFSEGLRNRKATGKAASKMSKSPRSAAQNKSHKRLDDRQFGGLKVAFQGLLEAQSAVKAMPSRVKRARTRAT